MTDATLRHELEHLAVTALATAGAYGADPGDLPALLERTSFIGLGGDSMRAMTLAGQASDRLGVSLELIELLSVTPLATVLARAVREHLSTHRHQPPPAEPATEPETKPTAEPEAAPSSVQFGIWIREHTVGPLPYNLAFICFIDGPLDAGLLTAAVRDTTRRHEGLRSVFPEAAGRVRRRVLDSHHPPMRWLPCPPGQADFPALARGLAADVARIPFDLAATPPIRWALTSGSAHQHALILTVHHILLDGWAIGLVLREVFARYDALDRDLPCHLEPGVRPVAHRDWLTKLRRRGELDRQAMFWRDYLDAAPTIVDLPADRPRPPYQQPHGERYPFDLGSALSDAVRDQAATLSVTPTSVLLAAFALTVSRYTEATTLLVAMPVAGRTPGQLAELVATTTNVIPVRVDIDEENRVDEYLRSVQRTLARCLDHADLPFAEIVAATGATATGERHPLVQVAFGMHAGLIPRQLDTAQLRVRVEERHGGGAQFDLELYVREDSPSFAGDLEYATSIWQTTQVAGFSADFAATVAGLTSSACLPVERVDCLAPRRQSEWDALNATTRPYPSTSIDDAFRCQVRMTPTATAVRDWRGHTLTYAELERAAEAQASLLAEVGVRAGDTVVVSTGRDVAEVVAVLGILWIGAAYVGIEPDAPPGRVSQILEQLRPAAMIGASPIGSADLCRVAGWPALPAGNATQADPDPNRLAYVAFTSGSTGRPKGVSVTHRGVLRLVDGLSDYAPIGAKDRMLRLSSLSFDASTLEIWGALLTGASLEIHPQGSPSPAALGQFLGDAKVTVAWLTAGLFTVICDFALEHLGGLRYLLTGGDVVSAEHVRRMLHRHRGLCVVNGYGPTENTTFTTVHRMCDPDAVEDPLPIGKPVANTQVYVLDGRRRLVPPGAVGELYVAGDGLAAGYYGDERLTARSFGEFSPCVPARLYRTGDFVRLDGHGRLQFLGRRDDQVKIRGNRVELGEVRAVLTAHPRVADAVVFPHGDGNAKQLVAAYIPIGDEPSVAELLAFATNRLPSYLLPARWAMVSAFPLTDVGKLDRSALLQTAKPAGAYVADGGPWAASTA